MKVYEYEIDGSRHCREGVAVEVDGRLLDTYWSSDRSGLTDAERKSAVLMFDTDDFDEVFSYTRGEPAEWSNRNPTDRQIISGQHGLRKQWFIRKGSQPDYGTRLENARITLANAESGLDLAEVRVRWAREDVAKIEAERVPLPERGE